MLSWPFWLQAILPQLWKQGYRCMFIVSVLHFPRRSFSTTFHDSGRRHRHHHHRRRQCRLLSSQHPVSRQAAAQARGLEGLGDAQRRRVGRSNPTKTLRTIVPKTAWENTYKLIY